MKKQTKQLNEVLLGALPDAGYVRQSDLIPDILPFSAATLWRLVKVGKFPSPVKLSARVTAWRASDIHEWLDKLHQPEAA